jgi:predicted secreted protein
MILMKESTDYVVPETHALGKSGKEVWKFRGVMPGTVTVTFNYARPFDKDTPPAKTVTYSVTVQ